MGKKSAKKDRGYQTASEWAAEGGGFKRDAAGRPAGAAGPPPSHKTLPFTHCALTCEPFEDPVRVWGGGEGIAEGGGRGAVERGNAHTLFALSRPYLL